MLPVCRLVRADRHKVAKGVAAFGKNWQGWHYGFKMHTAIDHEDSLCAIYFTPANVHDAQVIPKLVNEQTTIGVGDTAYNAGVMREQICERLGCFILAPTHPKQNKKLMAKWQHILLQLRSKIEAVFSVLKEKRHLVTSYPRSVAGYFVHYIRVLLGYQMGMANS